MGVARSIIRQVATSVGLGLGSTRGGGGVPQSLIDKMVLWTSKEDEKDAYYVNKIGDQERESLTDGGIAGVVHPGRAIQYDGAKEQYSMTIGNVPDNFKLANNPITIFFRVKMDAAPSGNSLCFGNPTMVSGDYWSLINSSGNITAGVRHSTGSVGNTSSSSIADGAWHDIFILINPSGNYEFYVDNILVGAVIDLSSLTIGDLDNVFYIGGKTSYFSGTKQIRDFRLWSSAITSESDRDAIHRGDYVAGCTSWWFMEEGKEDATYRIKDAIGTNDLNNVAFDATSLVSGVWSSLLNKFGYSPVTYESDDLIEGDGAFSSTDLWSYTASRFDISGGTANFKAIDELAPYMKCDRVISFSTNDVLKITFDITAASGTPILNFRNQAGTDINTANNYVLGNNELIFRPTTDGTGIWIAGVFSGGSFSIDNFIVTKYEAAIISPKMNTAVPTVDLFDRTLTFFGQAKYNLEKVNETTVNLPDYVGELFEAGELITINDWYTALGVGNEILLTAIQAYQTKRQYYNDEQLIIIKADETLTDAEDTLLKKKLMLVSETYTPTYLINTALGNTEGANTDIYKAKNLLSGSDYYELTEKQTITPTLSPENKYVAIGWADYFTPEDPQIMLALCAKYDITHTFYRQIKPKTDDPRNAGGNYNRNELKMIEAQGSYDGNHGTLHISPFYNMPLYDGRLTPSSDDLRVSRSDGTNEFGYAITSTVDNSIGSVTRDSWMRLSAELGAKAWQDLTDADCLAFRKALGAFGMPVDGQNGLEVLESLDYLSNRYCGTTGTSVYNGDYITRVPNTIDGLEPSASNKIQGGIFQGAATTENHEIWERLLVIDEEYKKEFEGKQKDHVFWATPGGAAKTVTYKKENGDIYQHYVDKNYEQLLTGVVQITSSITGVTRSWQDVLRTAGYKCTMLTNGMGYASYSTDKLDRLETQAVFQRNLSDKKPDNVGDGYHYALRQWLSTLTETDIDNALASADVEKYIYDLCATDARFTSINAYSPGNHFAYINEMTKFIAWGRIPDSVDDSGASGVVLKRASMALTHEALIRFCQRANINIISHEQAYEVATMDYEPANFFPNADFETTPKTVLASLNAPDYPDGWDGGEVFSEDTGAGAVNVLHINSAGTFFTRQYAIKPGSFSLSFKGKGTATLKIRKILNKDTYNSTDGSAFMEINSITINSEAYTEYTDTVVIEDAAMEVYDTPTTPEEKAYQNYMKGYGNKVCGIQIELIVTGVNYVKIGNCELSVQYRT